MTVQPGDVVKAVVTHIIGDNVVSQSVWHWWLQAGAEVDYATILAACRAKTEAIYDDLAAWIRSDSALTEIVAHIWAWSAVYGKWLTGPLIGVDTMTDTFGAADDPMPNQMAAVITAFTDDVNVRSRKSFGGIVEGIATENEIWYTPAGALTAALAEWLDPIDLGGGDTLYPVVCDKTGVARYLLYGLVSGLAGTQRQRKPGEGV